MSRKLKENIDFHQSNLHSQRQRNFQTQSLQDETQDIHLSPCLISEQECELESQIKPSQNGFFSSKIGSFLAGYCEMEDAASALRKKWMVVLSIFVCSTAALDVKEIERLIPVLFFVSYVCLVYHIIEDIMRYFSLKTVNLACKKAECLFELTDKIILMLFLLSFNLYYYGVIHQVFILLTPVLFLLEIRMYLKNPLIKQSDDKDVEVICRAFYLVQSFLIAVKMNNIIDLEWKWTLVFLWIYLGLHAVFVILTGLLFGTVSFAAITNGDTETLRLIKNKIIGYIWHISHDSLMNVVGLVVLVGVFQKIESNSDDLIETGLLCAKNLSIFLVIYTAILFPILKKFRVNVFEDLRTTLQNQVSRTSASQKKYTLLKTENGDERKIAFFSMVSATYFNLLTDFSPSQFKEMISQDLENPKEENLCYICESKASNAILTDCGHGGVCCDCAVKLIEQKNECMGCRKPANAIYIIESNSRNGAEIIVQASELVQILEVV